MRSVCDDRATWLPFLKDLDVSRAPDINHHTSLYSLSSIETKEKLVRAFLLEYGWRTAGALGVSRRATANVLPREIPEGVVPELETRRVEPHIIPGGKHVLLRNCGQLELWSVNPLAPTCLWTAPVPSPFFINCMDFDFHLQQEGAILVITAAYVNIVSACKYA